MARHRDKPFHRKMIGHRAAVHVIEKIADELLKYGSGGFYTSYIGDNYDSSVYDMVEKIKQLKSDSKKYHELKKVMKNLID